MPISNGSLEDEDCSDITDWTDGDNSTGVSNQTTVDGKEVFRFNTGDGAPGTPYAKRSKDSGSVEGLGNRVVVSLSLYLAAVGTIGNQDYFYVRVSRSDWALRVYFASNGLFIENAGGNDEVGANIVQQEVWQEWTFDVDLSAGIANATCNVYLNKVLQASDVSCNKQIAGTDGESIIYLLGYTTDYRLGYLDWYKVGDDCSWDGKLNGITSPAKIMGISVTNISKVMGV